MKKTLLVMLVAAVAFAWSAPEFGSLKDLRDGQTYKTVKIGKQTWMAENLNYAADSSWCYKDDPANCAKYGRLYTWDAATKACPTGWHLPTSEEWDELEKAIGEEAGTKLKSTDWDGTDAVGFIALPAGSRSNDGDFASMGSDARFWTATQYNFNLAYYRSFFSDFTVLDLGGNYKDYAYSVRCLQD